jgi:hypothetical protein
VKTGALLGLGIFFVLLVSFSEAALLSPADAGFGGQTRSANYEELVGGLFANGNVTTTIGDKLWVPWFGTSSSCVASDLKSGSSCNSGETIDFAHNCMVTDEFSQVGILVSMGNDQDRMDQFFNTVNAINSSFGRIPAWRVYRDGTSIEQCRSGINGNCDTASDATARIIIALYTASDSAYFTDSAQKTRYEQLATNLSRAMLQYETVQSCKPSNQGYGSICYWLAAGSQSKNGGMGGTDFGYTGYYADAVIAMLQACSHTGDMTFCAVAGNFTLNYLQAANFDGSSFTAPPGRSFKWINTDTMPEAECTNTCNPDRWDSADATRAFGMCHALYYAQQMNVDLPRLAAYCAAWKNRHMTSATSVVLQYNPDGSAASSAQSGYYAQGLQALHLSGSNNGMFEQTLDSALGHYSTSKRTFDNNACFGVYTQAFAVRALGVGIGRDAASFAPVTTQTPVVTPTQGENTTNTTNTTVTNVTNTTVDTTPSVNTTPSVQNVTIASASPGGSVVIAEPNNQTFLITLGNPSSLPTAISWLLNGVNQTAFFNSNSYVFRGNYSAAGSWNLTVKVLSSINIVTHTFLIVVSDTVQSINTSNATNTTINVTNTSVAINTTVTTNTTTDTPDDGGSVDLLPLEPAPAPEEAALPSDLGGSTKAQNNASDNKSEIPGKDKKLLSALDSYFEGKLSAKEAVDVLRSYYGES